MTKFKVTITLTGEAPSLADVDDDEATSAAWDALEDECDELAVQASESSVTEALS